MDNLEPIRLSARSYGGKQNAKRRAERQQDSAAAPSLEEYLNAKRVPGKPRAFLYAAIARDLGLDVETVRRLLHQAGGGHNGITI